MISLKLAIIFILSIGRYAVSLECYHCANISNLNICMNTTRCPIGQSCFLNFTSAVYDLGCIENQQCGGLPNIQGSLVGRSLGSKFSELSGNSLNGHDFAKRDIHNCFECCSSEICNKHICEHLKPTACIDDPKVDCALMNSKFGICHNIHEAKTVCPSFCGLCSLIDGNWADWSAWSGCDVTCATGSQIRTRNCTNPTPISGGLDCPGNTSEIKSCSLRPCPIDGNWADWSIWSNCDVTCENGTQTRIRSCSNPVPAYNGDNCTGNSIDVRNCVKDLCPVHGGWTQWFPWEPCSVTCDFGLQRRYRNCTNPIPQRFGDHCFGDSIDDRICLPGPCANGGWSTWGAWSGCSVTCGDGIKSRSRTCTNPRPSALGLQCEGDSLQDVSCSTNKCLTPTIAFRSKDVLNGDFYTPRRFVFTTVLQNDGNAYDNNTGIFTAPISGTYSFSTQLCIRQGDYIVYTITLNGTFLKQGLFQTSITKCFNAETVAVLSANDRVWVESTRGSGTLYVLSDMWNMFSGSLLHE